MARGEMLPIQHAARALGVPDDQLRRLAEQRSIPGAVDREGQWLIPTMSLVTIARQQGWTLDLAALQQQLDEQALSRYSGDALAAQAAVLLAKTQATAARVENRDLLRRLREARAAAEADRAARVEADETLADLQQELEEARRKRAVAEARLTEVQRRVSSDDQQFQFMVDRITSLEQERHRLTRSLGWFGRLRYRRLVERHLSSPPSMAETPADDREGQAGHDGAHVPSEVEHDLEPPAAHRPPPVPITMAPIQVAGASTVADGPVGIDAGTVAAEQADEPASSEPDQRPRRYIQVPRTPDGRFDRAALARARSSSAPLPSR